MFFMRNRDVGMTIRVTPEEKKKLARNAKRCGLSLSGYIRNLGLGREINPIPDKDYYRIYHLIDTLRDKAPSYNSSQLDAYLEGVGKEILKLYCGKSDGGTDGNDKNLAG
jgi:hypothetical protein